ncbi:hypothetical protein ACNKHU_24855 [Shigella flexneri]
MIAKDRTVSLNSRWANDIGVTGGAFDSYLLLRGLRTLVPRWSWPARHGRRC